jgi:hypothetical protein
LIEEHTRPIGFEEEIAIFEKVNASEMKNIVKK